MLRQSRGAALRLRLLAASALLVTHTSPLPAAAVSTAYTDPAALLAALPSPASILDFDGLPAGTLLPSGSALGGVTFTYTIAELDLKVVNTYDTTSAPNSLGLTGGDDALLDGDELSLGFAAATLAIGLSFITSDPPLAAELLLSTPAGTAGNAAAPLAVLPDGGLVYFVGLVSSEPFGSADITFLGDGEVNFAFNIDDILLAAPEPSTALLLGLALVAAAITTTQRI